MYKVRQPHLSQNFLHNRELVKQLVRESSITSSDTVLEIGSGHGIITRELLKITPRVIAIEKDSRFTKHPQDFLTFPLPVHPYKVFSNIPFAITGAIVRKLLQALNPPSDCYLIMQAEAAAKFMIHPKANTLAAIFYYPFWGIRIIHRFARTDFSPTPAVDSVLLRLTRRSTPLVSSPAAYQDFIAHSFTHNKFAKFVPPAQSKMVSAVEPWLKLFSRHNPTLSRGAFTRLTRLQSLLPPRPRRTI